MERKETDTAAAGSAPKARESHGTGDLISRLPDDILCVIISLLPTKEGGRTQALSRRWRHLWRSAPLNLEVCTYFRSLFPSRVPPSVVSKVLSRHPGPARRFDFPVVSAAGGDLYYELESWFHSRALANLQELDIRHGQASSSLPSSSYPPQLLRSLLRSASTLLVVKITCIDFPDQITPPMSFPLLKQLSLATLSISGDVFHGLLSGCHALESLLLSEVRAAGCLRVSSSTLRRIGLQVNLHGRTELVIEDAPRLERLLLLGNHRDACRLCVRIMSAPELEILGPVTPDFSRLQLFQVPASQLPAFLHTDHHRVFQVHCFLLQGLLSPVSPANSMRTVKVLAVGSYYSQLNALLCVLRWFPCLEKLYVIFFWSYQMDKKSESQYEHDPLHPIECLETHLKKVVLQGYSGYMQEVDFPRFFVLNAKVLNTIEFQPYGICNSEMVANLHRMLHVGNRASRDVHFEFSTYTDLPDFHLKSHIHDMSVGDPFRYP
uniref:Uncharacterized protein n=1 Tax=Avena sativa TaxID=4498 RepID=A0ACD5WPX9_AVESA